MNVARQNYFAALLHRNADGVCINLRVTAERFIDMTTDVGQVGLVLYRDIVDYAHKPEALAWLQSMTTTPQPVLDDVEVTQVDTGIRLGDVRKLLDPSYTGIAAKVLVAGTHLSAEPGSLAQRLRLVVLLPMFNDLDRALASLGIATFDQLDTYLVAQGITTFDALDAWLLSLGGL